MNFSQRFEPNSKYGFLNFLNLFLAMNKYYKCTAHNMLCDVLWRFTLMFI